MCKLQSMRKDEGKAIPRDLSKEPSDIQMCGRVIRLTFRQRGSWDKDALSVRLLTRRPRMDKSIDCSFCDTHSTRGLGLVLCDLVHAAH